jgi:hypothetical protein
MLLKRVAPWTEQVHSLCFPIYTFHGNNNNGILLSEYKKADQKLIWFVGVGACGWLMRQ